MALLRLFTEAVNALVTPPFAYFQPAACSLHTHHNSNTRMSLPYVASLPSTLAFVQRAYQPVWLLNDYASCVRDFNRRLPLSAPSLQIGTSYSSASGTLEVFRLSCTSDADLIGRISVENHARDTFQNLIAR